MSAASILGLVGAVLGGGMPLDGVVGRRSSGTHTINYRRGYQCGEGYNLTRERDRRVRQAQALRANMRCEHIVDWTCTKYGERAHPIVCREYAEWRGVVDGTLTCSDCYSDHDASGRRNFEYIGDASLQATSNAEDVKR